MAALIQGTSRHISCALDAYPSMMIDRHNARKRGSMKITNTMKRVGLLLCASALLAAPAYANVPKEAEVDTEPAEIIDTTPAPTP